MSEVLDKMQTRRSIRRYKTDMIPKDVIEKIVEAGTFAASGMNLQTPVILAVTNKEIRDKMSKANAQVMGTENDPFYGAPVVLVVLAEKKGTYVYDGSLVMGNLMLAAHELGIGSRTIMMDAGQILFDFSGEERARTTVDDLMRLYSDSRHKALDNDRMLLQKNG